MLKVSNIQQYYGGSHILRDVSLSAELGQVTVLLGRNGVGKTTLLKSLMGTRPIKDLSRVASPCTTPRPMSVPERASAMCRKAAKSLRA